MPSGDNMRQCRACGRFHPPPWDERCPSKLSRETADKFNINEETVKNISEFCSNLNKRLLECENYKALINGIDKLIDLKGIKRSK